MRVNLLKNVNAPSSEFRRTFKSLLLAIHASMESQIWLLKFVAESSSTPFDYQKKALLGLIEAARGILEVVRGEIAKAEVADESDLPEA